MSDREEMGRYEVRGFYEKDGFSTPANLIRTTDPQPDCWSVYENLFTEDGDYEQQQCVSDHDTLGEAEQHLTMLNSLERCPDCGGIFRAGDACTHGQEQNQ